MSAGVSTVNYYSIRVGFLFYFLITDELRMNMNRPCPELSLDFMFIQT